MVDSSSSQRVPQLSSCHHESSPVTQSTHSPPGMRPQLFLHVHVCMYVCEREICIHIDQQLSIVQCVFVFKRASPSQVNVWVSEQWHVCLPSLVSLRSRRSLSAQHVLAILPSSPLIPLHTSPASSPTPPSPYSALPFIFHILSCALSLSINVTHN